MNQQKLEELAADYAVKRKCGHCDYMNGVYDYLEAVWHDADELPESGRYVLVNVENIPKYIVRKFNGVAQRGTIRWAYIEDLLPSKGLKERKEEE